MKLKELSKTTTERLQVYTQPVFQLMEVRLAQIMRRVAPPLLGRVMLRVVYVLMITLVAILVGGQRLFLATHGVEHISDIVVQVVVCTGHMLLVSVMWRESLLDYRALEMEPEAQELVLLCVVRMHSNAAAARLIASGLVHSKQDTALQHQSAQQFNPCRGVGHVMLCAALVKCCWCGWCVQ